MAFLRRKRKPEKPKTQPTPVPFQDPLSATEKAYLDKLQKSIASPKRSPYIERHTADKELHRKPVATPLFDSGPMTAEEMGEESAPSIDTDDGRVTVGSDGVYHLHIDVPAADLPEEEQAPSPPPQAKAHEMPPPPPRPKPRPAEAPSPQKAKQPKGMFPKGTLVLWDGDRLGIYVEHQEDKGYDLLFVVESGGKLQPKGVCLFAYDPIRVGMLSDGIYQWMSKTMQWNRDAIMYHLEDPSIASRIPALDDPGANGGPAPGTNNPNNGGKLVRGQKFTIKMGDHLWRGVYWGRDQIGSVVAHDTNREWSLMHLDLARFASSLQLGEMMPPKQIDEIESAVNSDE